MLIFFIFLSYIAIGVGLFFTTLNAYILDAGRRNVKSYIILFVVVTTLLVWPIPFITEKQWGRK